MSKSFPGQPVRREPSIQYDPETTSHSEATQEIHKRKLEEYRDMASTVQATLPAGFKVEGHKAWKGYGMTLHIPKEFLPRP